jgi:ubiquinone/menaquinone biosynthesis C-methylase UbiE
VLLLNWKLKVLIQFVLAHAPRGEQLNYILQMLNSSHSPAKIAERMPILAEKLGFLSRYMHLDGAVVLEIGTGWEPINALLLHLVGAKAVYSYDHVQHVRFKLAKVTLDELERGLPLISSSTLVPQLTLTKRLALLKSATDLLSLFKLANITYVAPGDAAKSGLPDHSVDLVYSYAVLEHVPEETIHSIALESRRVLRPGGMAFHIIGPFDHYANVDKRISKVNFLQYPEWKWKLFVKNRISYHNRLRAKEFVQIFRSHGAEVRVVRDTIEPSDLEALKTMKIDARFAGMTQEELAVSGSEVLYLVS